MESSIAGSFENGVVLITGSTGFLGKMLTEKLLRCCPVNTIAILVRGKKGLSASQRVEDIYKQTVSTTYYNILFIQTFLKLLIILMRKITNRWISD